MFWNDINAVKAPEDVSNSESTLENFATDMHNKITEKDDKGTK